MVIPCERYDYMYFGIDTTVTMNFVNRKAIAILCPPNINEISCERNLNLEQMTM
jgi:hypothetical protein